MYEVRAKKHLGQHFLKDENIAANIVASLTAKAGQVVEVGPGTGVLTKYLLRRGFKNFRAVEIDRESAQFLRQQYPDFADKLVEGDFLKMDVSSLFEGHFAIIGNFPYNISSQIFFRLLENRHLADECVGMLQKEVAVRIAAPPGNRDYGILSVLLQAWYHIEYLFTVDEHVFAPPPKVKSAVVRLRRNDTVRLGCDESLFFTVVKTAFNQRRKTLHNALKPLADYNGEFAGKRAEQLGVEQFVRLTASIQDLIS